MTRFQPASPPIIVDASFAVEALGGAQPALELLGANTSGSGMKLVPAHFWLEIANALLRIRASEASILADLRLLADAGIEVADRTLFGASDSIGLARAHQLTTYDAAYLQLALDVEGELATYDRALAQAATAEGVVVRP